MLSDVLTYAVVAGATLYLLKLIYAKLFLEFNDDIPTIGVIPLLGVPKDKVKSLHTVSLDQMKKNGVVWRTVNLLRPWQVTISIADPNLLKEIFVGTSWQKFDRGHPSNEPFFPYSSGFIHTPNGNTWRDLRAMFEKTFNTVNVRKYTPILLDLRTVLLDQMTAESAKAGANTRDGAGAVDLYPFFHYFTWDTITRLTFGTEAKAQTTEEGKRLAQTFDKWQQNATGMYIAAAFLGKWAWKLLIPKVVQEWKSNGAIMYGLLNKEKEKIEQGKGVPSIMKDAYDIAMSEKMSEHVSDEMLRSGLMSILFAGHDTTAALLGFLTFELSKRPDLQAQIRAEVNDAVGKGEITNLEALEKCKILNACIKETLRRYPSAPGGAGRYVSESFDFNYTDVTGQSKLIKFRKNDLIGVLIYGAQNHAPFWTKDPSQWDPSRFYDESNGDQKAGLYTYSPFGNGARRCLGERLALGEARLCTASILRKWELVHVPGVKMEEVFTGTIKPSNVMVKLVPVA